MSTSVKVTVEQYEAMIDRGEFLPRREHQVELIRGELVPKYGDDPSTPMNPPHAVAVDILTEWSFEVTRRDVVWIRIQGAVSVPALDSVPEPDISWLARKDYSKQHPRPEDVLLLIEVSDATLSKDQGTKLELYAEAGIREYWIVNIQDRRIDVYRNPQGTSYTDVTTFTPGQEIHPLAFPDVSLAVSRLFPE